MPWCAPLSGFSPRATSRTCWSKRKGGECWLVSSPTSTVGLMSLTAVAKSLASGPAAVCATRSLGGASQRMSGAHASSRCILKQQRRRSAAREMAQGESANAEGRHRARRHRSPLWQNGSLYPSSVDESPRCRVTSPLLSTSQMRLRASSTVCRRVCTRRAGALVTCARGTLSTLRSNPAPSQRLPRRGRGGVSPRARAHLV